VSVAGNVSEDEVIGLLDGSLATLKPGTPTTWFAAKDGLVGPRVSTINRRTEQSHISIGMHGLPLGHADRYSLDLLSVLFGESMSSRLFMELRERQGLCYDVNSYVTHFLDAGSFGLYAAVDPSNGRKAVGALMDQLKHLAEGIPEEELTKARELAKGRMLLRLEDTRSVSGWLGGQEILTSRILSPEDVVARLDAVTPEDLTRVARGLLNRERLNLALVGPHRSERVFMPLLQI
jgi:predicted Zn-dependent peptidase